MRRSKSHPLGEGRMHARHSCSHLGERVASWPYAADLHPPLQQNRTKLVLNVYWYRI